MIALLSLAWKFEASQPASSALTAQAPQATFAAPTNTRGGFTVTFTVDLKTFDGDTPIVEIPNVLEVRLRQHDPNNRDRQNYPSFKMPDGSVPVLEATVTLHSIEHPDWRNMTIGIPLARLETPEGKHEVVLHFSGARWTLYVDGTLLDNDFPFGYPQWADENTFTLNPEFVRAAAIYAPGITPVKEQAETQLTASDIQYWTPHGHNNWVGDVASISHDGRYHLFYLYDRRHHQSKFDCGAHYFEHISTKDFITWTEHEAATPLDEQWECIGTGAPFVFNSKLCISYGLHTTRVYPREATTLPVLFEYLEQHGQTPRFEMATTPGMPAGSTYSLSEDGGEHFEKSHILYHPCENPSVYTAPDGQLRLLANAGSNGIWESDTVEGGWRCVSPGFPPGGDCTFFFRWGAFDYIIGGFTGLWSKPADAPDSAYEDLVARGLDFYDGSAVPTIAEITGGRFLIAAWIQIRGWGGNLLIRELVQLDDGRIGSKWMREIMPAMGPTRVLAETISETTTFTADDKAVMLEFDVTANAAKQGKLGIAFLPAAGEHAACELQISLDAQRAQFGPGSLTRFADRQPSIREGGLPHSVGNYAIDNLIGTEQPFRVRVIVKGCDKIGGTLVDAEIAGHRTMISYRADLDVKKFIFRTEGLTLGNVGISRLGH